MMIFSENNSEISKALVAAWANMKTPKENATANIYSKKGSGSSYSYKYTDLKGLLDAARETFVNHGVSVMQNSYTEPMQNGVLVCVETMLLHNSGEWVKSYPLKYPLNGSVQDMGGLITSMKRYTLASMIGVASESGNEPYNNPNYNNPNSNNQNNNNRNNNQSNRQSQPNEQQILMPKNASEAGQMIMPFGNFKGRTLKELYKTNYDYLIKVCDDSRTPQAIKTGVSLMAAAVAQKNAQKEQQQGVQ